MKLVVRILFEQFVFFFHIYMHLSTESIDNDICVRFIYYKYFDEWNGEGMAYKTKQ